MHQRLQEYDVVGLNEVEALCTITQGQQDGSLIAVGLEARKLPTPHGQTTHARRKQAHTTLSLRLLVMIPHVTSFSLQLNFNSSST